MPAPASAREAAACACAAARAAAARPRVLPYYRTTVRSPIFAAARSLARRFCSPKSILTGAPRAAAGPGHWLALVRALAARDPARARSQLRDHHVAWSLEQIFELQQAAIQREFSIASMHP